MIKEIVIGSILGFLMLSAAELLRTEPHTCVMPKEEKVTDRCDSWKTRTTCYTEDGWDFIYEKSL